VFSELFVTDPAEDKPNGGEDFAALFAQSEAAEKSHRRVRAGDLMRGRVVARSATRSRLR
jgi:hypothetical protein